MNCMIIQKGGRTLLYASQFGLVSIVQKLVEKQCNVNLKNKVVVFLV